MPAQVMNGKRPPRSHAVGLGYRRDVRTGLPTGRGKGASILLSHDKGKAWPRRGMNKNIANFFQTRIHLRAKFCSPKTQAC